MRSPGLSDFTCVGEYRNGAFKLDHCAIGLRGLYAWVHHLPEGAVPRRIGIACARGGLVARYVLYNRWLLGRFKPNDRREQEIRRLTQIGLGPSAEVWAYELTDREQALELETRLRSQWASSLTLDLMVSDSWIKTSMAQWRSGTSRKELPPAPVAGSPAPQSPRAATRAEDIEAVARAFLDHVRKANGAEVRGIDAFNAAIARCRNLDWVKYAAEKPRARAVIPAVIKRLLSGEYQDIATRKQGQARSAPIFYHVKRPS